MTSLIHEPVRLHAESAPDRLAVKMGDVTLSYGELEMTASQLAGQLLTSGCRPRARVGLFAAKSPEAIAGMVATLKLAGAYVPIDITSPSERVERIIRTADLDAILVHRDAAALVRDLNQRGALKPDLVIGALDDPGDADFGRALQFVASDTAAAAAVEAQSAGSPSADDIAQILFTSGSTGEPKGVAITHANVSSFLDWAVRYFGISSDDRLSGHPPLHFDLSTFDIYGCFRAGAELHLVPPGMLLPRALRDFILDGDLTHWFSVPSVMTYMTRGGAVPDSGFPRLRHVRWCGEVLPTPVLSDWMKRIPQATFTNLYGPTETTIASSYYTVAQAPADESEPIPIGTACAGEELVVLSESGQPAEDGATGELCIGGYGLSPGYWRDDAKTAAAFIPDPRSAAPDARLYRTGDIACRSADGLFHFRGRRDSQIKSRGYRIELGEVEAALNALPEVGECAVVAISSDGFEGALICGAVTPTLKMEITAAGLRSALSSKLPSYMLPARWWLTADLPKNGSGKIDRRALREQFAIRSQP